MANINELVIYRVLENVDVLRNMSDIMSDFNEDVGNEQFEDYRNRLFDCVHKLVDLAGNYGFEKNLWHNYLTLLLVNNENVFSTACEIKGISDGTLLELAKHDFEIFREFFAFDFSKLEKLMNTDVFDKILNYKRIDDAGKVFNRRIRDRICDLSCKLAESSDLNEFTSYMIEFYSDFGVGKLGLHKAFRVVHSDNGADIVPITNIAHVNLDDLVGYETAKKKLIDNTEAFVKGKKANNCLLFGDAGTGKSSSIKAILNKYYDDGLRIIEVYKHQFQDLNLSQVA